MAEKSKSGEIAGVSFGFLAATAVLIWLQFGFWLALTTATFMVFLLGCAMIAGVGLDDKKPSE